MRPRWLPALPALLALSVVPAPSATAAPAPQPAATTPALTTVTLVTGDVVSYGARPDGPDTVLVTEPRPGIQYTVYDRPDGWYVLPSDAADPVLAGRVDETLFNVTYLVANGYADDARAALPVLVDYGPGARTPDVAAADALPASTPTRTLPSIDAVAVDVTKTGAAQLWQSVTDQQHQRGAAAGTLLLDRVYHVDLAQSVAQINAPDAWAAGFDGTGVRVGVLDTGYDATHPDLAGRVVEEASFVAGEPDLVDRHGHGTHVAATIAGSGAAAGGVEKGVAPGAQLVVGKVLNAGGQGLGSEIVAGMEWAAGRSRIVSMSLGGTPPSGADPLADAVASLSASTGALFVIAAGNSGPGAHTVNTPGVAPAALTVGAVDAGDQLANFSSRGPARDGSVKPEVVAPGVDIVAARAAEGDLGTPVDAHYTSASGTSMATPHVAGEAAILAQQHPDWPADRLKAAVVGSTKDLGTTVNDQGAGRVDVAAAIGQGVLATPSTVNFGVLPAPQQDTDTTLSYRNDTAADVTLDLATRLTDPTGKTVDGVLSTATPTVTVPAGGQADVVLRLRPGAAPAGSYQGLVTATSADGAVRVHTPVGFANGPVTSAVTLSVLGFDGAPDTNGVTLTILPLDRASNGPQQYKVYGGGVLNLQPGAYFMSVVFYGELPQLVEAKAMVFKQEVRVDGDTAVEFDLSSTKPVRLRTDDPVRLDATVAGYRRTTELGQTMSWTTGVGVWEKDLYVNETPAPEIGDFSFQYLTTATRSPLDVRLGDVTVHPEYFATHSGVDSVSPQPLKMFDGRRRLGISYVADGTAADFASAGDLRGRLVLVQPDMYTTKTADLTTRAHQAGAAGMLVFAKTGPTKRSHANGHLLPVGYLSHPDGLALLDELHNGRGTANVAGTPVSPYAYHLGYTTPDQLPDGLTYDVRDHELARIDTTYHAPADTVYSAGFAMNGTPATVPYLTKLLAPAERAEYYGPADGKAVWTRFLLLPLSGRPEVISSRAAALERGHRSTDAWLSTPLRYGQGGHFNIPAMPAPYLATRTGDAIHVYPQLLDGAGHVSAMVPNPNVVSVALHRDGAALTGVTGHRGTRFAVAADTGRYRLDVSYQPGGSYRVDTSWEIASAPPAGPPATPGFQCWGPSGPLPAGTACQALPTISVDYDLDKLAPGVGKLRFRPYHVSGAAITGATLSVSTDGGAHWTKLTAKPARGGWLQAKEPHLRPGTAVSLRVQASDGAGNTVTQTIIDAYRAG